MTQVNPLLTATEVVELLGEHGFRVSDETIRQWARIGRIACVRVPSGRFLFRREVVDMILTGPPAEAAS